MNVILSSIIGLVTTVSLCASVSATPMTETRSLEGPRSSFDDSFFAFDSGPRPASAGEYPKVSAQTSTVASTRYQPDAFSKMFVDGRAFQFDAILPILDLSPLPGPYITPAPKGAKEVPESGATVVLLGIAAAGMAGVKHRFRRP